MVTANESRAALELVSTSAVAASQDLLARVTGSPTARRAALLNGVPDIIAAFSDGSAALAVDFYEEERARAGVRDRTFVTQFVVNDRTVKIRRGVAWAADPLFSDNELIAEARLAEVVQLETARPYRDTILANRRRDPASVGWTRIPNPGACRFCRFLAAKGAIYKRETATFAAHPNCHCSAAPVFKGGERGPEASAEQYIASKRKRTPKEREELRGWLDYFESTGSLKPPAS